MPPPSKAAIFCLPGLIDAFTGCAACGATPDQYGNARKNLFDYVHDWTDRRFPS